MFAMQRAMVLVGTVAVLCGTGRAEEPLRKLAKALAKQSDGLAPEHRTAPLGGWINSLAFAPNGKTLAIGLKDQVQLFGVASQTVEQKLTTKVGPIRALAFSPDGKRLAIGGYQKLQLWAMSDNAVERELTGHRGMVTGVAFSADGNRLASSSDDETARIWSTDDGALIAELKHRYPVNGIAWSRDGHHIATASGDELRPTKSGEVMLWSASGELQRTWSDHARAALAVAFTPDGKRLLSGGLDEKVIVRNPADEIAVATFEEHGRPVTGLVAHPAGPALSIGGGRAVGGNKFIVWNPETLAELGVGEDHEAKPTALALSQDGKLAATGSQDQTVILWNVAFLAAQDKPVAKNAKDDAAPVIRVGVIGLDTSHAPAFAKLLNDPKDDVTLTGCRVVAAYPKGSPDIESSTSRVADYVAEYEKLGIEIVDSIPALLEKVDCVLLETNDGRPHLEQALPVLKASKTCFIDKPIAGSLIDAVAIFEAAKHYKTPVFSSSSLRYAPVAQEARAGKFGEVLGCDTFGPASLESTHPDLFWYGIHGVEMLFTVMGTGCESVTRAHTKGFDVVVGTWEAGRLGTFRGIRDPGKSGFGGHVFGSKGNIELGGSAGYKPLVIDIVKFFKTKQPPVAEEETLEIYAFMEAADESKRRGGVPVKLSEVLDKAREEGAKKLKPLLK
jgi:predicted dehydrogenase/sugar lactone lactonase YvrE